ncbi:murein hydrolase activator EnvC family protein [Sediminitomix flava]|uniref:Septal ring factor EnvC (AmiA/AmiB activator) n=1 Tax=Sediminitomix flava TaxID=379075 RepID=A0A315ZE36_SEDFL|nr:peptidoglycan DD-metalloendopeptidase family protein [Sediminitomix flava]PWJ43399.1 septal ring factor EnvC (AmiA/AmiB activator) [Sediminitomix flava]
MKIRSKEKKHFYRYLIFILLLFPLQLMGQQSQRKKLESQRKSQQSKVREMQRILSQTQKDETASIAKLKDIKAVITERKKLINELYLEHKALDKEIIETEKAITDLEEEIKAYKEEYAKMIYLAYKNSDSYQRLIFLFSSEDLRQFLSRLNYLRQYQDVRKQQIHEIEDLIAQRNQKRKDLSQRQFDESHLIDNEEDELQKLADLQAQEEAIRKKLSKEVNQMTIKLVREQKALGQLEKEVSKMIAKSTAEKTAKVAKASNTTSSKPKTTVAQPKTKASNTTSKSSSTKTNKSKTAKPTPKKTVAKTGFASLQYKMDWPVKEGFVSSPFGQQEHPMLKGVIIDNPGIDIRTKSNEAAYAVYGGTVKLVSKVSGINYMITVQHGEYFTVYAKLKEAKVKVGDEIKKGQQIGIVATDEQGMSELLFQIWKGGRQKLDPEKWLKKK